MGYVYQLFFDPSQGVYWTGPNPLWVPPVAEKYSQSGAQRITQRVAHRVTQANQTDQSQSQRGQRNQTQSQRASRKKQRPQSQQGSQKNQTAQSQRVSQSNQTVQSTSLATAKRNSRVQQQKCVRRNSVQSQAQGVAQISERAEYFGNYTWESNHLVEVGPSGKPTLSGEDYKELKKMLRDRSLKITRSPKFGLRDLGDNASLVHSLENRCPLFLSDIQHLLMYSQLGVHAPYSPARWCSLEKYNQLANVTVLVIENLSLYHYESYQSHFPFLSLNFEHKLEIISPFSNKSDVVKELSLVPLSSTQMRKAITEYGSLEEAVKNSTEIVDTVSNFFPIMQDTAEDTYINNGALPQTDKFSRMTLLLSGWQMIEENFPLPIKGLVERKYSDYVLTKKAYKSVSSHSQMMGIDCEMCRTTTGDLELTRISVVNEKHQIIYDTLVKPKNKIVDYLTRYSGINPKMMKNVTKRLADVQRELSALLPDDAILVGQSLSNDLHAVKMMHPYVIDTSVIYNLSGDRTRKTKLQILAREFLDMKIQMGTKGHCSSEDSLACLKLVQLKLSKHIYYGDAVMNSVYTEQRAYPDLGTASYATSMLKQCVKAGNKANIVGVDDLADNYKFYIDKNGKDTGNIKCTKAKSNRDVITHLCDGIGQNNLNIGHIRIAEDQLTSDSHKVFQKLDRWIGEMHCSATQPSLLAVILSGNKIGGNGVCCLNLKRDYIL